MVEDEIVQIDIDQGGEEEADDAAFFISPSSTTTSENLRRAYAIAISRGMLPYGFVNSPGKVIYNAINNITC